MGVPNELKEIPQWILWKYIDRDGRRTKMPVDNETGRAFEAGNAWDKPHNWLTYDDAQCILTNDNSFSGLGLVLTKDLGLYAIDLDTDFAEKQKVVEEINSYTETSPSGKGLRIFAFGSVGQVHKNDQALDAEIYSYGKWVSVTGNTIPGHETVQKRSPELRAFLDHYFPSDISEVDVLTKGKLPIAISTLLERDENLSRKWYGNHADLGFASPSEQRISLIESFMYRRISIANIIHAMRLWREDKRWDNLKWALHELNRASEHWQRNSKEDVPIKRWTIQDLMEVPQPKYLVDKYLCEDSLAVLFGQSGLNKSFLALDWSLCVALGRDWGRWSVPEAQPVLYVAAEGFPGFGKRVRAWFLHNLGAEPTNQPVQFIREAVPLADPRHADRFLEAIRDFRPKLIVLDTMNWFFGTADENFAGDMKLFLESCKSFQTALNCCVLLVTHPSKAMPDSERGSSVLSGAAQTRIHITPYHGKGKSIDDLGRIAGKCVVGVVKQKDDATPARLPMKREVIWEARSLVLVPDPEPEDQRIWHVFDLVKEYPGITETALRKQLADRMGSTADKFSQATVRNDLSYWNGQGEIIMRDGGFFCT